LNCSFFSFFFVDYSETSYYQLSVSQSQCVLVYVISIMSKMGEVGKNKKKGSSAY